MVGLLAIFGLGYGMCPTSLRLLRNKSPPLASHPLEHFYAIQRRPRSCLLEQEVPDADPLKYRTHWYAAVCVKMEVQIQRLCKHEQSSLALFILCPRMLCTVGCLTRVPTYPLDG
ncbi:hypothetical protein Tco_0617612 [Tanacetum coccineum]